MLQKTYQKGFTLIELIIVISLVAILSAIAAPSFNAMTQRNAAQSAANNFKNAMMFARSQAITNRTNTVVCSSNNIAAAAPICNGANWNTGLVVRLGDAVGNVLAKYPVSGVVVTGAAANTMIFNGRMGTTANAQVFTITANGNTSTVSVFASGMSQRGGI